MFFFYMPETVKHIGLSAVVTETNTPVSLNGEDIYQYRLGGKDVGIESSSDNDNDDTSSSPKTKSLVVKGIKCHLYCNFKFRLCIID